ncbi:MAG: T9SS type A sorting domain-containing protein [Lewinellaceae bacterium]|nr:T9SS type A sorting domain-containing protein [Saprospiraceae bacterium]MCB9269228.1 T9SS type A sorting domain-containing protein [Lewinellaceae bacterium]HPG06716.1 T9SS type A sorting domain-containing protein [Saprospiraceae bacterium]HPR01264.1 T9SS type A sorting domain-containing protein [Saprospiraceae bacterium]
MKTIKRNDLKFLFTVICFLQIISGTRAQSIERFVIGSTGGLLNGEGISMDHTVGEVAVSTLDAAGYLLTQGFHQGSLTATSVDRFLLDIRILVTPVPARDRLNIQLETNEAEITYQLIDLNGKPLGIRKTVPPASQVTHEVDVSKLASGTYIIYFRESTGVAARSVRFIKY